MQLSYPTTTMICHHRTFSKGAFEMHHKVCMNTSQKWSAYTTSFIVISQGGEVNFCHDSSTC